jgi:hypothetical protein
MNSKELMTAKHIGKRVAIQSIEFGIISFGTFEGIKVSEWDGSSVFSFTDGFIGDTAQKCFQFPVSDLADTILLNSEVA